MADVSPDSQETKDLLQQARAGDRAAFEQLLERHRPYLCHLVELRLDRKLRSRLDPSDVVQETQLEALRQLDSYLRQPALPFRLWLRQLAYDRMIMQYRYHAEAARRAIDREVALPERSALLLARQLLAAGSTPSQRLARHELAHRVRQAVALLPEADREILLLRTYEGLSFEELAYLLEIEPATARKRHGRALLRLHRLLSETGLTESQL